MKKNLLINTLEINDPMVRKILDEFKSKIKNLQIVNTDEAKIKGCIGCTNCWLKTPGICTINDDFNGIFKEFLKSDSVILLTEGNVGFISSKMKNIIERLLPLATPYTKVSQGTMRHVVKNHKNWNIALVYEGKSDKVFLNEWMKRFTFNLNSNSLGAYTIEEAECLCNKINDI